jgi:hypothetical protein
MRYSKKMSFNQKKSKMAVNQNYKKKYDPSQIYAYRKKTKYPKSINKAEDVHYNKSVELNNSQPEVENTKYSSKYSQTTNRPNVYVYVIDTSKESNERRESDFYNPHPTKVRSCIFTRCILHSFFLMEYGY